MRIVKIHILVSSVHNMDRLLNRKAVPIYREHHGSAALAKNNVQQDDARA